MIDTVTDCLGRKKEDVDVYFFHKQIIYIFLGIFYSRQELPLNQGLSRRSRSTKALLLLLKKVRRFCTRSIQNRKQ